MGVVLWFLLPVLQNGFVGGEMQRIGSIVALSLGGASAYFGLAAMLGIINRDTINQLRRRQG